MDQHSHVVTSNFSALGPLPDPSWYSRGLVPAVVFSLCFSVGVPGNIAVIILRPNWEHLSILSQSLMLNLAMSDLLCLLTLPLWIHTFLHGWTFILMSCKLLAYIVYCSIYGSLLTVTGLSIQRYLVVVHQQRCHQIKKRLLLVFLWLVAFILSIPSFVVRQLTAHERWTQCLPLYSSEAQLVVVLSTEIVVVLISFFVVAFSYILLHKKINKAAFFNNPQTTRLVTSIIVSFFVLWVPYVTVNVLGAAAVHLKNESLLKFYTDARRIVASLTFVNSCLNPLLYAFTSYKICTICPKKQTMQQNHTTPQTPEITTVANLHDDSG